jgi:hypothetical protein
MRDAHVSRNDWECATHQNLAEPLYFNGLSYCQLPLVTTLSEIF